MLFELTLWQWQNVQTLLNEQVQLAAAVSNIVWAMLQDHSSTFADECMYEEEAAAFA